MSDQTATPKFILPEIANGQDKSSDFVNCIRNSYRHIRKWARRTHTNCFRIYDRELYHYPLAIDFYDNRYCLHYFCPRKQETEIPDALATEIEQALVQTLQADPTQLFWRSRIKRAKTEQYEKAQESGDFFTVFEYGARFRVNLVDYLDTGLFLDHRELRQYVAKQAKDKRLLNLFSYTGSFSVHAALQGARYTKSVDLSNTYCDWAKENFRCNFLPLGRNEIVRADCMSFLEEEIASKNRYDIIVIDPPTISRSKKMRQMFDVQQDYPFLLDRGLKLLAPGGCIFFSTNLRTFSFDTNLACKVEEITKKTHALDFHDPNIHRAWKITPSS